MASNFKTTTLCRGAQKQKPQGLAFGLHTLYLFTKSDFKTVILPTIAFATSNTLSSTFSGSDRSLADSKWPTTQRSGEAWQYALRISLAVAWTWLGLLMENLANQRLPSSIIEDSVNKPWRPIPSGRISSEQARALLIATIAGTYLVSLALGVQGPFLFLALCSYLYNDLGGADQHLIVRNILNACGLMSFGVGATVIASAAPTSLAGLVQACLGTPASLPPKLWLWVILIGLIITATVSTQDLEDVEGDRLRKRRTLPLVLGDQATRIYLAASIPCWTLLSLRFWYPTSWYHFAPAVVGTVLSLNLLTNQTIKGDKISWRLWCLWVIVLYMLPAI